MHELAAKVDEYARGMISGSGSTLFEELGLYYIGPVDGHNMDDLITILNEVKSTKTTGPVLIHVVTEKGRGYPYAERAADKYHGKNLSTWKSIYISSELNSQEYQIINLEKFLQNDLKYHFESVKSYFFEGFLFLIKNRFHSNKNIFERNCTYDRYEIRF